MREILKSKEEERPGLDKGNANEIRDQQVKLGASQDGYDRVDKDIDLA